MGIVLTQESTNLELWIPAAVSILTLVLNLMFYILVQPRLTYKATAKEVLSKISVELLNYLSEIVSLNDFSGVPTQIRKYSLQIHLHFKEGTSDGQLELLLEQVFQAVKKRKTLTDEVDIIKWNDDLRDLEKKLRKQLAKYCGAL